jgi:acetolactate synthase-1/2/3 large subunit
MMHGNEVSTAAAHHVGAIWVVLFDDDLGMVSQGMNHDFDSDRWTHYYTIGNPDIAKFSEALGADAYNIHSPDEMRDAFSTAIKKADADKKPQVIVARIDRKAIPPYYPPKA